MTKFYSSKRVGGIRFVRLGRLQLSFCVCKAQPRAERRGSPARGLGALYGAAALYIVSAFSS